MGLGRRVGPYKWKVPGYVIGDTPLAASWAKDIDENIERPFYQHTTASLPSIPTVKYSLKTRAYID